MSNKIVPVIYRAVIDDVISNIKTEFDEYGVSEDVLADLQRKWEAKVIASHVADFELNQPATQAHPGPHVPQQGTHVYPTHTMQIPQYAPPHNPYAPTVAAVQSSVKSEPIDPRYALTNSYMAPPGPTLPGPTLNPASRTLPPLGPIPPHPGGQTSVLAFPRNGQLTAGPQSMTHVPATATRPYAPPVAQPTPKIPQVDGPSESSGEDDTPSPPPSGFAPRSSHPSLPQPAASASRPAVQDSEAINSDLDDSDTGSDEEQEEGGAGDGDIVFCTYDKVARVKNKWKCVLKDGMIHINGKDYLFSKCTGEFEW